MAITIIEQLKVYFLLVRSLIYRARRIFYSLASGKYVGNNKEIKKRQSCPRKTMVGDYMEQGLTHCFR